MAGMRVMVVTPDAERRAQLSELLGDMGYELSIPQDRQTRELTREWAVAIVVFGWFLIWAVVPSLPNSSGVSAVYRL